MYSKRIFPILVSILLLTTLLFFVASVTFAEETKTLSFATTMEDYGIDHELTQRFAEKVNKLSDGLLEIDLFMSGILGGEREIIEQMQAGEIDLAYLSILGTLYFPEYDASNIPFLWPDWRAVEEYLKGPIGYKAWAMVENKGNLIFLGEVHQYGARWLTSNRPIEVPEDLNGLMLRLPDQPIWNAVWRELGAKPTPISAAEIVSSLRTGVVDAQENFLTNLVGRSLWEVQDYAIATKHISQFQFWTASKSSWEKLTHTERNIIRQAITEAVDEVMPMVDELNEDFVQTLKENDMNIIYPDYNVFAQAAMPKVKEILEKDFAPEAAEEIFRILDQY